MKSTPSPRVMFQENPLRENLAAMANISSYRHLDENWDSYGAKRISEEVIEKSRRFIEKVNRLNKEVFFTAPGPNGEISIEMHQNNKAGEFIFYPEKDYYVLSAGKQHYEQGDLTHDKIIDLIKWLNE
jgi:hypothetical protein